MATIKGHLRLPRELVTEFELVAGALPDEWDVRVSLDRKPRFRLQVAVEGVEPKKLKVTYEGHFEAGLRFLKDLRRALSQS